MSKIPICVKQKRKMANSILQLILPNHKLWLGNKKTVLIAIKNQMEMLNIKITVGTYPSSVFFIIVKRMFG